jgi:hypothetical protein
MSEKERSEGHGQSHCPRCGTEYPPAYAEQPGSTLDEDSSLVEDHDLGELNLERMRWVQVGEFMVCPVCATLEEERQQWGCCVRCGKEDDDDGSGQVWWVNACPDCTTRDEERTGILEDYLKVVAESIAFTRACQDWDKAITLEQPDSWVNAVEIMLERGVPNHLHYTDPINPLAGPEDEQPCWDTISDELQTELRKCKNDLFNARYAIPDEIPEGGYALREAPDWWLEVDWWLVERAARRYVSEAGEAARSAPATGGA